MNTLVIYIPMRPGTVSQPYQKTQVYLFDDRYLDEIIEFLNSHPFTCSDWQWRIIYV